jgi:hypothetical protein
MNNTNKTLLTIILIALSSQLFAQDGFKYQAVVRASDGSILANQTVSVRMSIILENIANSATYQETHSPTTDAYGVINLTIGDGTIVAGTFSSIDWSKTAFLKIEMDVAGGSNYSTLGTTQLLNVPKALYAEKAGALSAPFGLNVKDYGAVGDNTTDDTQAFQDALDAAKTNGNRVIVPTGNYKITSTLMIEDGVTLVGESLGSTPLQTPYNGSAIRYTGSGFAVKIIGHTSGIRDMQIFDASQGSNSASGVQVLADGEGVESVRLFNVLIIYFTGGTGLELSSINSGGIAYFTSYNTRIRHAKTGLHITEDATSFTNSNVFHHGAISGGGFDNGILIDGGNNNQFYGTIIEPGTSTNGHIVVNDGEIQCYDIRIEGNSQPATTPLVHFKTDTRNSTITGTYAGGLTIDEGNNYIGFRSGKAVFFKNSRNNLFENASFYGFDGTNLPYWDITNTSTTAIESEDLFNENKVLKLTVSTGVTANLEQAALYIPSIKNHAKYSQMNVGMYVKASQSDMVYIRTNAPSGVTVSQSHPGDGEWHYISMNNLVNTGTTLDTKLEIANSSGSDQTVYITAPTFNFGNQSPEIQPKPITSAGGILTGTLAQGTYDFTPSSVYIVLPKEGNIFFIEGTQNIQRINHSGTDKFPKGAVITMIFDDAGLVIADGVYIDLKSSYTSTANSSLTLVSMGDGTWLEIGRNL